MSGAGAGPELTRRHALLGAAAFTAAAAAEAAGLELTARAAPPGTQGQKPYKPSHAHDQPQVGGFPGSFSSPELKPYVDPLPIPQRRRLGGRVVMAEARHRFHRDLPPAPSWGYGGMSHLGPTIEARRGERRPTTFVNRLGPHILGPDVDSSLHGASELDRTRPPSVVHLHGAPNPPGSDGHPMGPFRPGEEQVYRFSNSLEAATLWYHDHAMGTTRLGVYAGLAGMYLVRDAWDTGQRVNPLGLPAGRYEIPLIICDKVLNADGSLRFQGTPTVPRDHWAGGLCGDLIVVNGKVWPRLAVDRGVYRFRAVNATQLNDYRLHLSNRMPFWVIGSDGGLLDKPALVEELDIANGERYDLLIDFSSLRPGESVDLMNSMQIATFGQMIGAKQVPNVMRFTARARRGRYRRIPGKLRERRRRSAPRRRPRPLPRPARPDSVRTATVNVTMDLTNPQYISIATMNLNNLTFRSSDHDMPVQGTTERWDFVNSDMLVETHALHLHLVQFRVLERQDYDRNAFLLTNPPPPLLDRRWTPSADRFVTGPLQPPAPYERGWKDTVRCPPDQITRVVVRWPTRKELGFDPDAPFQTPGGSVERGYVWHCHMLDHEDHEMMQRLRVVAPGTQRASWAGTQQRTGTQGGIRIDRQRLPDLDSFLCDLTDARRP